MAHHNVYTFFSVHNCLDEDFDAPDEGDSELCRAIVAGRMGLHPDGWSNQNSLTAIMPLGFRKYEWSPFEPKPAKKPRPTPVWRPKPPKPPKPPAPPPAWDWRGPAVGPSGDVQLTCDDCEARFRVTMYYRGNRPLVVQSIRLMGKTEGWTCILGRDRCPKCSQPAAPEAVSNGAGGNQGDEQHA